MKFGVLCTLRIENRYYRDRRCPDFRVEPSPATARVLQRHRHLVRSLPDGLQLIAALDGSGAPLLPIEGADSLVFRLILANRDFLLFTQPPQMPGHGLPVFVPDEKATGADRGVLRVSSDKASSEPGTGQYGEVHLSTSAVQVPVAGRPREFRIQFEPKAYPWRLYFCSNRVLAPGAEFGVTSTDRNLSFQKVSPAQDDGEVARLGRRYPGHRILCFESVSAVPCQEPPLPALQLSQGGHPIVAPVSTPSFRNFGRFDATDMLFVAVVDTAKTTLAIQN